MGPYRRKVGAKTIMLVCLFVCLFVIPESRAQTNWNLKLRPRVDPPWNSGGTKSYSIHKLIPGRFYGGSVQGHFSLSSVVQPGASIMRKTNREVLGSNPGPDRKNVRIEFRPPGIPWGVNSRSLLQIPIRLGSRLWNYK